MPDTATLNAAAFRFVQDLAKDLSRDDLELPGFPDVVARLHRALGDPEVSPNDVTALVSSEPALAARLVKIANSAAFNTSGREVTSPRAAVTQLGFNMVRNTAMTFAMRQMEQQEWLAPVRPLLAEIWRRSNAVGGICTALAEQLNGVRPDEAMAAGLFHQIGNLYLVTQAHRDGIEVAAQPGWDDVVKSWHPTIARAFVESWGMNGDIGSAVEQQDTVGKDDIEDLSMLTRLLSCAKLYDGLKMMKNGAGAALQSRLERVYLGGRQFVELVESSEDRIETVRLSLA